ncbi:MAG TPA: hypothetical protein DCZ95_17610 [Verrucomicrobia bacterium]|nr:MAG: hypothetical protein A2X46_17680 [Lentisphaerae bacterium GWF2_57_35]HBA85904.1 hypothetical protein [Verrucomicrobiota bacterium]
MVYTCIILHCYTLRHRFFTALLLGVLSFLQPSGEVWAQTSWYVDGNNTNDAAADGTIEHPFIKIRHALTNACDGDAIWITNGLYAREEWEWDFRLTNAVTLRSWNGPTHTIIIGTVYITGGGTVEDVTIRNGGSNDRGGGVFFNANGGLVNRCVIKNNCAHLGAGIYFEGAGTARCCAVIGNTGSYYGGNGGGMYFDHGGRAESCTIAGNHTSPYPGIDSIGHGGGIYCDQGGEIVNSIVWGNSSAFESNWYGAGEGMVWSYSCTAPAIPGINSIDSNPEFIHDGSMNYRLQALSPCRDAAFHQDWMDSGLDLLGTARKIGMKVDLGAYEYGPLEAWYSAPTNALQSNVVTFAASTCGLNLNGLYYRWDIDGDGTNDVEGFNRQELTYAFEKVGMYRAILTVSNACGEVSQWQDPVGIRIGPPALFVATNGLHLYPFANWTAAATNIQAAVMAATDGSRVFIASGEYALSSEILVTNAMTISSECDNGGVVCRGHRVRLAVSNAILDGLTITGGNTAEGGGVKAVPGAEIRNCLLIANRADYGGGGHGGRYVNCTIISNIANAYGSGLYAAEAVNCIFSDNTPRLEECSESLLRFCCTSLPQEGEGNVSADPQFRWETARDVRLLPSSPCVNAGTNVPGSTDRRDLLGEERVEGSQVDMGACELGIETQFMGCFSPSTEEAFTSEWVVLRGALAGAAISNTWFAWDLDGDTNMDQSGWGLCTVSNRYTPGSYRLSLWTSNSDGRAASWIFPRNLRVAPSNLYVSSCGAAVYPYDTWEKAAVTPQPAISAGIRGSHVWVRSSHYYLQATLAITTGVKIISVRGETQAILDAAQANDRCVRINHPEAVLDGFTITGGRQTSSWQGRPFPIQPGIGAGVMIDSEGGTIRNCLIAGNRCGGWDGSCLGAGVYCASVGYIQNCTIAGNESGYCAGLFCYSSALVENSIIDPQVTAHPFARFRNACFPQSNASNHCLAVDPQFVDAGNGNYRLPASSPCVDAGTNLTAILQTLDLTRSLRCFNHRVDMGAYEYGSLDCSFTFTPHSAPPPFMCAFSAAVFGVSQEGVLLEWDLDGDGQVDAAGAQATFHYNDSGLFAVRLQVSNAAGETNECRGTVIASYPTVYVSLSGMNISPYTNWQTAATSLTAAVAVSGNGTTVLMADGAYSTSAEGVVIRHGMQVRSVNGSTNVILIGGGLVIDHPDAVVEGLQVRGEGRNWEYSFLGGVYCRGGLLRNVSVSEAWCSGYGEAHIAPIYCVEGGRAEGCSVFDNSSYAGSVGIVCDKGGSAQNCRIFNNRSYWGKGIGLYCGENSIASDCIISSNETPNYSSNEIVRCENGGRLDNCLIAGNSAPMALSVSNGVVRHCTVVDNRTSVFGLCCEGNAVILNTIVYHNTSIESSQYLLLRTNNLLRYCCTVPTPSISEACIVNNPLFVSREQGDYHLQADSPCIDSGTDVPVDHDLDRLPRPMDGNNNGIRACDMGVYEFANSETDLDQDGLSDGFEAYQMGSNPSRSDTDGDDMTDSDEWKAGTDPRSVSSVFQVHSALPTAHGVLLQWDTAFGKGYRLQRSADLGAGAWTDVWPYVMYELNEFPWGRESFLDTTPITNGISVYRVLLP